jgi:hypothetical protein
MCAFLLGRLGAAVLHALLPFVCESFACLMLMQCEVMPSSVHPTSLIATAPITRLPFVNSSDVARARAATELTALCSVRTTVRTWVRRGARAVRVRS